MSSNDPLLLSCARSVFQVYEKYTPVFDTSKTIHHSDNFILAWGTPFILSGLYTVFLLVFPKIQRKHKFLIGTVWMKVLNVCWNIFLSTYSCISFWYFISWMIIHYYERGSFTSLICTPEDEMINWDHPHPNGFWYYLFMLSKFFEMFDTVLLVLKKPERRVNFLHTYHHISVSLVTWWGYSFYFDGYWMGAAMNTFIHWHMYFYYALTTFFRPPWGFAITCLQILQMFTGSTLSYYWTYLYVTRGCSVKGPCPWLLIGSIMFMYFTYLLLFVRFMFRRYFPWVIGYKPKKGGKRKGN